MKETDWQERAVTFARQYNLLHTPATHALDLTSEVGEVAKEILEATEYGRRAPQFGTNLSMELGDALYSLLVLSEVCGVDAREALEQSLAKMRNRLTSCGIPPIEC